MDDYQKAYYKEMRRKDRLVPFIVDGKTHGFVTFFIGNGNVEKYVREDMWSVVDDEPLGDTCYVDHLITNKDRKNCGHAHKCFSTFVDLIKNKYPNVKRLRWNRVKEGNTKCTQLRF